MERRIRWGILGTASIAAEMAEAISRSRNGELVAVASRSGDKARRWADQRGLAHAFGSYDELLARTDLVDAVYVPLPNSLHAHWTIRALQAGLPVLCEKPLAPTAGEALRIAEVAARTGLMVAEGFMYRHHPVYARLFELIAAGTIGRLTSLRDEFTFLLDDRAAIPASAELAGGALLDVGCYAVHLARWVVGQEPDRVAALARFRDGVDDHFHGLIGFGDGLVAHLEASIASAERHRVQLAGTDGSLILEQPWVPGRDASRILLRRHGLADEFLPVPAGDAYRLQVEAFADACLGQAPFAWPLADAVANLAVIDALFEAARTGRTQRVVLPGGLENPVE